MKKIFTLGLGLMITVVMFAADRRPVVTVTSAKRYAIMIDGNKQYLTNGNTLSIADLFNGQHDIKVFKARRASFTRSPRLVASSQFWLGNSDVQINIDRFGQIQVTETHQGYDRDHDFGRRHQHDNGYDHDRRF